MKTEKGELKKKIMNSNVVERDLQTKSKSRTKKWFAEPIEGQKGLNSLYALLARSVRGRVYLIWRWISSSER